MGLKHDLLVRAVKALNIIAVTIPFFCSWLGYYRHLCSGGLKESFIIILYSAGFMMHFIYPCKEFQNWYTVRCWLLFFQTAL